MPRVVVTGIGLITPLGLTTRATWQALLSGTSGVQKLAHHASIPVKLAAPIAREKLPSVPPILSPCPDFAAFTLLAAREALLDAALLSDADAPLAQKLHPHRAGTSIGVGMAHLPEVVQAASVLSEGKYRRVSPFLVPRILPNTPAGLVALRYGLQGPNLAPATACAAGAHALGDAFHIIRRGDADVMLAGGAEAAINPISVAGFARAKALTTSWNDDPTRASRPFDVRRDGFVIGEGACVLVLEACHHAAARGIDEVYAEVCGFGMSGDAHHITSPSPDGNGAIRAMKGALGKAHVREVSYVNAHATSTAVGDAVERHAIAKMLPVDEAGAGAVVSSTKGATGHLLGAAGAVEAAFAALAVADGIVPPTLNLTQVDDDERVKQLGWGDVERYVPKKAVRKEVSLALSNSFGFGGTNACVAFAEPAHPFGRKKTVEEIEV